MAISAATSPARFCGSPFTRALPSIGTIFSTTRLRARRPPHGMRACTARRSASLLSLAPHSRCIDGGVAVAGLPGGTRMRGVRPAAAAARVPAWLTWERAARPARPDRAGFEYPCRVETPNRAFAPRAEGLAEGALADLAHGGQVHMAPQQRIHARQRRRVRLHMDKP